jgi:hypothetical protein
MKIRDVVIGANASIYYRMNFKKIKGVFYPRIETEVIDIIAKAHEKGYDVTPKGGGSGLSGACTGGDNERIMISSLRMNQIFTISKDQGYVDAQPGATPDEINELIEPIGMKFWIAPSSRDIATIGGILSTDGGGNDSWINGTMRDNTLRVKMVLYDGSRLIVDWKGVKSDNEAHEAELNKAGMTIHDIASAHGTLGFITEMRVAIRPQISETLMGGLVEYSDANALGAALHKMIEAKSPIRYGETILAAHEDVREELKPPVQILQFPKSYQSNLKEITDFRPLTEQQLEAMKDIRIKLPKRNPKEGIQVALFEGYGFHDKSLIRMQDCVNEIDELLRSRKLEPFAKYGHAPSKWYLGTNEAAYGMIMHSREIKPEHQSGKEIFETVVKIVDLCSELGITPKPEHKWPFSDKVKRDRLNKLRKIIGSGFNSFILDPNCNETLSSMV